MNKANEGGDVDEMLSEYDFREGERGKYVARVRDEVLLVQIDPELRDVFDSAEDVNRALRLLAQIIRQRNNPTG